MPTRLIPIHFAFRIPHSALRRKDGCAFRRAPLGQSGIALFLVLWVLTLLSVIVGEFCHAMRGEVNTVRNFKEETEAYYIAQAGLYRAIEELVKKHVFPRPPDEAAIKAGEESPPDVWRVNTDIPAVEFGQGTFKVHLENESGKMDLNSASPAMLRVLLNAFDLDEKEKDVIVDSILDWRDKDDLHRLNGAEDDYYLGLEKPYPCKDGDFDSVEELLLVRGVSSKILYGGLIDMVTVLPDGGAGTPFFGPVKKDKDRASSGKINLNAASVHGLRAMPGVTEDVIERIAEFRKTQDIESPTELLEILGPEAYAAMAPYLDFMWSPYYTIRSLGRPAGTTTWRAVEVAVRIDGRLKRGYRILRWTDTVYPTPSSP